MDFLDKNNCGYTVDANDPTEITRVLITLADQPQLRQEMGAKARALAHAEFDKDILSIKMLKALEEVHNHKKL